MVKRGTPAFFLVFWAHSKAVSLNAKNGEERKHLEPVFGGKRANLEAWAAHLTPDTKNALFGVCRFQRFLHQKRSGDDEAVTSLVTKDFWPKFGCFGAFLAQKSQIVRGLQADIP